jgi:hypothetical protein
MFSAQMCGLLSEVRFDQGITANKPSRSNSNLEREMTRLQEDLRAAREDNAQLREKLLGQPDAMAAEGLDSMDESKLKSALIRAQRDVVSIIGDATYITHKFNCRAL